MTGLPTRRRPLRGRRDHPARPARGPQ